mgnify:CR=1 FL=1
MCDECGEKDAEVKHDGLLMCTDCALEDIKNDR